MNNSDFLCFVFLQGSVDEWDEVFFMCSGMYVGAALLFLLLGSSKEQPWAGNSQNIELTVKTENTGGKGPVRTESLNSQSSDFPSDTESALSLNVTGSSFSTIHALEKPAFTTIEDEVCSSRKQKPEGNGSHTVVATTNL